MTPIWTIGYGRFGLSAFIDTLRAARITALIDVRELANSRRAGFSKRALSAGLEEAGISYRHLKPLGTPKAGRQANIRGDMEAFWPIVETALARPEAELALRETAAIAALQRVCLMCLEEDPKRCHRWRVCEKLAPLGFKAHHLGAD